MQLYFDITNGNIFNVEDNPCFEDYAIEECGKLQKYLMENKEEMIAFCNEWYVKSHEKLKK